MSAAPAPRSLAGDRDGTWVRHWQHPQWLADVDRWVHRALAEHRIRPTGPASTYKIRFWSVVRCYPTDAGLYWFKENNPGQAFEAALIARLADVVPDHVVAPLAVRADHGWLLSADQGSTLGDGRGIRDQASRLRLVAELAALQRTAADHRTSILGVGVTDASPARVGSLVRERTTQLAALPTGHPLRTDADLTARLRAAADRLDELARRLDPAIPASLDHNDLHAFNVFGGIGKPLRFFDFGDSVWGHPFCTMRSLAISLHWTADLPEDRPEVTELVEAYLSTWSDLADPDVLRREYRMAAALLPVARVISWYRMLDHADLTEIAAWIESPRHWLSEVAALGR